MQDFAILQALQKATTAAVAASTLPSLPIKFVLRGMKPPIDQKWLEVVFIPNNAADFWGEEKTYRGMYRLILHWPNDDRGAYSPGAVLASICGYFHKDQLLSGVSISDISLIDVLEQGSELLIAASIRYVLRA